MSSQRPLWRELALLSALTLNISACKTSVPVPARIEAEDYTAFTDTTKGNSGGQYRKDDVDIEKTLDSSGGYNIGWVAASEVLGYNIKVTETASYTIGLRVATPYDGRKLRLKIDGKDITTLSIPNTGGWQRWTTIAANVPIDGGEHQFEIFFETADVNLNYIDFSKTPTLPGDGNNSADNTESNYDAAHGGMVTNPQQLAPQFTSSSATGQALISTTSTGTRLTRVGGRVRDRHARESQFKAYEHYLDLYFENRTFGLEIEDTTPIGGNSITVRMTTVYPHENSNFRAFFRGINTVAEYHTNTTFDRLSDTQYSKTITYNPVANRSIQAGDLIEMEVGVFLQQPVEGRFNYYSRAYLYKAGEGGILPWKAQGPLNDSVPLDASTLQGGMTSLSYNYSDEPAMQFMQMAQNIAPENAQLFVEGRRLSHTNFIDGTHSEGNNPVFTAQVGKAGPLFNEASCIACHQNNGRSAPSSQLNSPLNGMVVKVGQKLPNGKFDLHPQWGGQLQTHAATGAVPEPDVVLSRYDATTGTFNDGSTYLLNKPVYEFDGLSDIPPFSVRTAPALVGMGLLEAVPEADIIALADPDDANHDGISGRANIVTDLQTKTSRLGRFGWKAARASVKEQIAGALKEDMGVSTTLLPNADGSVELSDKDLSTLTTYIQTLGVPPQRNSEDPAVVAGATVFHESGCDGCHVTQLKTSNLSPLAELRNQTIKPYTDLLLHDMGEGLADNLPDGAAGGAEWRTAPLWGIGLIESVNGHQQYLHDGRANGLLEAILWHGGEGETAKQKVLALSQQQRETLLAFLKSL